MISKVAVQGGLGVAAVGGAAGAVTYALWDNSVKYLVTTNTTDSNNQPTDPISGSVQNKTRNYVCQWDANQKDEQCILKKITFVIGKNYSLLSAIKISNSEPSDNSDLTTENNWFLLKIKGYTDSFETTDTSKTIDIVAKTPTENEKTKKYVTLKPVVKINGSLFAGQTNLVLTQLLEEVKPVTGTGTTYKCKLKNVTGDEGKDCDVYKFNPELSGDTDAQKIDSLDFSSGKTEKIASPTTDLKKDQFYLIDLKDKKLNLSKYSDATIVYIEVKTVGTTPTEIGDFKIKSPLIHKDSNTTTSWAAGTDAIVLSY